MKKIFFLMFILMACVQIQSQGQDAVDDRDLSGTYNLWRAPNTNMNKMVKSGIKVEISQKGNVVKVYHEFKNYGNDRMDWEYHTGEMEHAVQSKSNARFGFGGWPDWNTGRYYIEIQEGVLAFFEGNPNYASDGECPSDQVKEITFVLYINKDFEKHLDEKLIKGKVNSMFKEICRQSKTENAEYKDLRGMDNMPKDAVVDFSNVKKLEGKYYVWRNDQSALRFTYTTEQEVELEDLGDQLLIHGKQLKVKKFTTKWDNNEKYKKIQELSGYKVLKANSSNEDNGYGLGSNYLVELEDGTIVILREVGYNYFSKAETCVPGVDNIDYILYKTKEGCQNSQLGQIKSKVKKMLNTMCDLYVATLDGPMSSKPLLMPIKLNTDAEIDKMALPAVQKFFKSQGWNDEVISCYISSADWDIRTEKRIIDGKLREIVISRYKNGVVIYKTSTGIYYKRGISFAQDVTTGHLDGVSFQTKTLYCPGILDGGAEPGSEFSLQTMTEEQVNTYKTK